MPRLDTPDARIADEAPGAAAGRRGRRRLDQLTGPQRTALVVAVLALGFLVPLGGVLTTQGQPMEEGFMLVFPELILEGKVPNVDFLHLYGPGSLWVLAGVFALFEPSLLAERLVGLAQQVGVVLAVVAIARAWGRTVALSCGAISLLVILNPIGFTALAWVGAVALGLWAAKLGLTAGFARPGRRATVAAVGAGLLAGFALLYRPDLIVALGLTAVVLLRGMPRPQIVRMAVGAAAGVSPYLVHVAMAGPGPAFRGMVIDPVFNLRSGRRLPVPPPPGELQGFLQKAGELDQIDWPLPMLPSAAQITGWFVLLLVSVVALIATAVMLGRRETGTVRARTLAVAAAFSTGMLPQALQRADSTHLAWVSCVAVAFLPVVVVEVLRSRRGGQVTRTTAMVAGGSVLALIVLVLPAFTARPYVHASLQTFDRQKLGLKIEHRGRTFYYGRAEVADALPPLLERAEEITEPGDRLFVGPSDLSRTPYVDSFIYFMLPDLEPATYYIEMDPGVANREGSGLAEDLASADIVVLSAVWDDWEEPNDALVPGSDEPNEILRERFCTVEVYGDGLFELLRRCPRGTGVPPGTAD